MQPVNTGPFLIQKITNGKNMTRKFRAAAFAETAAFSGRPNRFLLPMPVSAGRAARTGSPTGPQAQDAEVLLQDGASFILAAGAFE
jgi:hypothetical protein